MNREDLQEEEIKFAYYVVDRNDTISKVLRVPTFPSLYLFREGMMCAPKVAGRYNNMTLEATISWLEGCLAPTAKWEPIPTRLLTTYEEFLDIVSTLWTNIMQISYDNPVISTLVFSFLVTLSLGTVIILFLIVTGGTVEQDIKRKRDAQAAQKHIEKLKSTGPKLKVD